MKRFLTAQARFVRWLGRKFADFMYWWADRQLEMLMTDFLILGAIVALIVLYLR